MTDKHAEDALMARIVSKTAVIGVVGLGYVGLPFAVEKARRGWRVIGIDADPDTVKALSRGECHVDTVDTDDLAAVVQSGRFIVHADYQAVPEMDVIIICVPTPLTKNLVPKLDYIHDAAGHIRAGLRRGQLIILESTTYPGTTLEVVLPILEKSGLRCGDDFFLAYSPERIDPGNGRFNLINTPKVVGGVNSASLKLSEAMYADVVENLVPVSSTRLAEMTKIFENTFRAVNIALVNEVALLCDVMKLNVWELLDAAFTKPFGIMPFYPGPGVGGHCIPLDSHYLEFKAKEFNFPTRFISLAGDVNRQMPLFVREKAARGLNRFGIAMSRSNILVIGVAYKKDIGDLRESPALDLIQLLKADGARVSYYDPYIPRLNHQDLDMESVELTDTVLGEADLVVIITPHSSIDFHNVVARSRLVLDTRNATKHVTENRDRIILL